MGCVTYLSAQLVLPLDSTHELTLFPLIAVPCFELKQEKVKDLPTTSGGTWAQLALFADERRRPRSENEARVWELLSWLQGKSYIESFEYEPDELPYELVDGRIGGALRSDFRVCFADGSDDLYLEMTFTMDRRKLERKSQRIRRAEICNAATIVMLNKQQIRPLMQVRKTPAAAHVLLGHIEMARMHRQPHPAVQLVA